MRFTSTLLTLACAAVALTTGGVRADEDDINGGRPDFQVAVRPWNTSSSKTIRENIDGVPQARTFQRAVQALALGPYTNSTSNQLSNYTFFAPIQPAFDVLHFAGVRPYNQPSFSTLYTSDFKKYWTAAVSLLTVPNFVSIADLSNGDHFVETTLTDSTYVGLNGQGQRIHIVKDDDGARIQFRWDEHSTSYARIVESDIFSRDGVLHLIDNLVTVPTTLHDTYFYAGERNVYQALEFSGAIRELHNTTGTFFAPINSVLEPVLQAYETNNKTIATARVEIATLLKQHTIPQVLYTNEFENQTYTSLNGTNIPVTVGNNGDLSVGGASVVGTVIARNGVVYFIDGLIEQ